MGTDKTESEESKDENESHRLNQTTLKNQMKIQDSEGKASGLSTSKSSEYWKNFNKYFFSLCLLSVSTGVPFGRGTIDYTFMGFSIFLLFFLHAFTYFAFRGKQLNDHSFR